MGEIVYTILTNGHEMVGELVKKGWTGCVFKDAYYVQAIQDNTGEIRMGLQPFIHWHYSEEREIFVSWNKIIYTPVKVSDSFLKTYTDWNAVVMSRGELAKKARERDEGLPTANNVPVVETSNGSVQVAESEGVEIYRHPDFKRKIN